MDRTYQVSQGRQQSRYIGDDMNLRQASSGRYNQRSNLSRSNSTQQKSRYQPNKYGNDSSSRNWRQSDGNRSRSNYPQKSNGSYGNRNNYVQEIFDESQCKKIVENARKQFVSEYNDMDDTVTIVNDKLVYSISGILHIVQSIDFDKEEYSSPYQYTLFNKKIVRFSTTPPPPPDDEEEVLDDNIWDMPEEEDFSLDGGADILEAGRSAFLTKQVAQSKLSVERDVEEVERDLERLQVSTEGGGSLLDMLVLPEDDGMESISPLPDDMHTPMTPVEGLIDGIVTPTAITPRPAEEVQESIALQPFSEQGDHQQRSVSPEVPVDVDSFERSIVQEAKRLSPRLPEDDLPNSMSGRGMMGGMGGVPMSYNGGNSMMGMGMGVGMGMDRQPYPPMNGYGNYPQGYGNAPPRYNRYGPEMNPGMRRAGGEMGYGYVPDPMHMRDEVYRPEMDPRMMRNPRIGRDVYYVPNRVFNQIPRENPPDLFQMFGENGRSQQMREQQLYQQQQHEMLLRQQQMDQMRAQHMNEMRMNPMGRNPMGYRGQAQPPPGPQYRGYPPPHNANGYHRM